MILHGISVHAAETKHDLVATRGVRRTSYIPTELWISRSLRPQGWAQPSYTMDATAAGAALRAAAAGLRSGGGRAERLAAVKEWPKGYLAAEGLSELSAEVAGAGAAVVAGLNAIEDGEEGCRYAVLRGRTEEGVDKLSLAVAGMLGAVEPQPDPSRFSLAYLSSSTTASARASAWTPLGGAGAAGAVPEDVAALAGPADAALPAGWVLTVLRVAPVGEAAPPAGRKRPRGASAGTAPRGVHACTGRTGPVPPYALAGVAWRWKSGVLAPKKTSAPADDGTCPPPAAAACAALQLTDLYFSARLGKVRTGRVLHVAVAAVRYGMNGLLQGVPAAAYLVTQEGRVAGVATFTAPTSALRRFARRWGKVEGERVASRDVAQMDTPRAAQWRHDLRAAGLKEPDEVLVSWLKEGEGDGHNAAASPPWVLAVRAGRLGVNESDLAGAGSVLLHDVAIESFDVDTAAHPLVTAAALAELRAAEAAQVCGEGGGNEAFTAGVARAAAALEAGAPDGGKQAAALKEFAAALGSTQTPRNNHGLDMPPPPRPSLPYTLAPQGNGGAPVVKFTIDECETVEFKTNAEHFEADARKCINAYANTGGGRLFLGVADNGTARGVELTPKQRADLTAMVAGLANATRPVLPPSMVTVTFHAVPERADAAGAAAAAAAPRKIAGDWWKKGTAAGQGAPQGGGGKAGAAAHRTIVEVAVGNARRWPFYLPGPRSGAARVRHLASSDVLGEGLMAERVRLWLLRAEGGGGGEAGGAEKKAKKRRNGGGLHATMASAPPDAAPQGANGAGKGHGKEKEKEKAQGGQAALALALDRERAESRWLRERVEALEQLALTLSPQSLEQLDAAASGAAAAAAASAGSGDTPHEEVNCRLDFSEMHSTGLNESALTPDKPKRLGGMVAAIAGVRDGAGGGGGPLGNVTPSKMVITSPSDRRGLSREGTPHAFCLDPMEGGAPSDTADDLPSDDPIRNGEIRVIGCPPVRYGVRSPGAPVHKVVTPPQMYMESGSRTRPAAPKPSAPSDDASYVEYIREHLTPTPKKRGGEARRNQYGDRASEESADGVSGLLKPARPARGTDMCERVRKTMAPPPSPASLERLADAMMKELARKMPFLPIRKVATGCYTIDHPERKYKVAVHSGTLVVRVGSGYEDVVAYLMKKANTQSEMKIKARMMAAPCEYDETY